VTPGEAISPGSVARDTSEIALIRLTGALAILLPLLALQQALANASDYSHPGAEIVIWLAVIGSGMWLVPRLRAGRLTPRETAAAIAIALAAVGATGFMYRPSVAQDPVDMAILGTMWLLALVAMSSRARVWVPAALLVFAVHSALLIRAAGLTAVDLSGLGAAGYIIAAALFGYAALRSVLHLRADLAALQASMTSQSAAERAAADAVLAERRARLAGLETEALPLLRAIAAGTLDPADSTVRELCARHAAALRDSLAGANAEAGGDVAAGLGEVLRAARARGLPVTVQAIGGEQPAPPPAVARAVRDAVGAVLAALEPLPVVLTMLSAGEDAELYLAFTTPPAVPPDLTRFGADLPATSGWQARLSGTDDGGGCLELSWRQDCASSPALGVAQQARSA
jgi:hypothetical protein